MNAQSRRLTILTPQEIDDLYGLPRFTDQARLLYFDLSENEQEAVDAVRTVSVAVHLILQIGYFKAKRQFFIYIQEEVRDDVQFILRQYFTGRDSSSVHLPSKPTRLEQQQVILELFGYRICDQTAKNELECKAQRIAMLSTQPEFVLNEALQHLAHQRIVAPGYSFLQEMVSRVVASERQRITHLLDQAMTTVVENQIDALLQADDRMYRVSVLKREPKNFSHKELRQEVERRKYFQVLYEFTRTFLTTAGISSESVKYYASLVKFYTVYKLQRMPKASMRLYLLCFAFHRFRQINDNLVEAFIHLVNHYEKQARQAAGEVVQQTFVEVAGNLRAAGEILRLFVDDSIPSDMPFSEVKAKAFSLLDPGRFSQVTDYMRKIAFDKSGFEWANYTTLSPKFKRNLRHLFVCIGFAGRLEDAPLLEAAAFLQDLLRQGKSPRQAKLSTFPVKVIPKTLQRHLFVLINGKEKILDADRYEFMVYRMLRNAFEAGDVFVQDSTEFRRFEDDLISDTEWQHKDAILREIGAPVLLTPIRETIAAFREAVEAKFKAVNQRIADGSNEHIKVGIRSEKRHWKLVYPNSEDPDNSTFYSHLPSVGIADLMSFVAEKTRFLDAFTHVLDRYVKHKPDPREILACIVAMGTNMGLGKMAEVSGIGYALLMNASNNFLRQETIHAANDLISNAIAAQPVFHLYDIGGVLHSSSDGQRLETQIDTINSRHSPKYFGLKKGVSACTLIINHVPVNTKIIGAHEYEGHHVFDLLYNNTSDIKPAKHSTDTHGTNLVNFWTLYTFGYYFAPRYRDLYDRTNSLVGFKHPSQYGDFLIRPARKVSEDLIVDEWPNVQRIMASLAQKEVTQSTIIRKLSSYTRQNRTKKALWELDNFCRTLYILEFIDDSCLRQCVQKALNRGETYHRLRRAVAYVNSGRFRVQTEAEQQIWNECSRLIANAIIFYNSVLLSKVLEQKQAADDQEAMNIIAGISPIAWQHINLFGTFEFNQTTSNVDINALAARYADPVLWSKVLKNEEESLSG